ncbi:hypothetical protein K1T71_008710, partial [Dendrolimus kikuchii]
ETVANASIKLLVKQSSNVSHLKPNSIVGVTVLFHRFLGVCNSPLGYREGEEPRCRTEQIIYYPSFCRWNAPPYLLLWNSCHPNFQATCTRAICLDFCDVPSKLDLLELIVEDHFGCTGIRNRGRFFE